MARTASVFTRVDPEIKVQAESVLNELGISMATAMEIYLRQIAFQRKIPFEIKLQESNTPTSYGSLSDEEFNELIGKSLKSYSEGLGKGIKEFKEEISKELEL